MREFEVLRQHPDRVARTNWFARVCLNAYMDMDYKTLTNKVCQCHPRNWLTEHENSPGGFRFATHKFMWIVAQRVINGEIDNIKYEVQVANLNPRRVYPNIEQGITNVEG